MKKKIFHSAGLALAVAAVTACGGGGGGTSSSGANTATTTVGGITGSTDTSTPMTLLFRVNGVLRAADQAGQIAVAAGDQIDVVPNQTTTWSGGPTTGSPLSVRNASITGTAWSAQILNGVASAGSFTLTARSTTTGVSASVVVLVAAGDARNGSYEVFATNGTRQKLALNFDSKTYEMTDSANVVVSGSIAANAESGTWDFVKPRGVDAVTAHFRLTTDTVVGNFPFSSVATTGSAYKVQPFIASRALLKTQAALDGTYNRFGISLTATGGDSQILQMRIRNGGTVMEVCNDNIVYTITACPAASVITNNVSASSTPDRWNLTNVADGSNQGSFSVARVADQNVYLNAMTSPTLPGTQLFRVGTVEGAFTNGLARGGDTTGAWGANNATATTSISTGVDVNGVGLLPLTLTLGTALSAPTGMRNGVSGSNAYFVMHGSKIGVMVGKRANPATEGYIQIGVLD